jgi:hypothetical protein
VAPLALALHVALASPGLVPRLEDPGPFSASELAAASVGAFAGDVAVIGSTYLTLQLFANDVLDPNAQNFRRAAYVLGATAVLIPPLTAVLLARWVRREPASGAAWKAMLLATAAQLAAIGVGIAAWPHYWVMLPVQLVTIGVGTSLGLHWGPRARDARARSPDARAPAARDAPRTGDEPDERPAARLGWPGQCVVG